MSFAVSSRVRSPGSSAPNGAGKSTTMRVILGLGRGPRTATAPGSTGKPYASLHKPMSYIGSLLDAGALQPSRSASQTTCCGLAHSQGLTRERVDEVIEQGRS